MNANPPEDNETYGLNEEEMERLNEHLSPLLPLPPPRVMRDMSYFLRGWFDFVSQVEIGYSLTIYDYINDLAKRDILERLLDALPDDFVKRLTDILTPLDERLRAATTESKSLIALAPDPRRWWYFRVPNVRVGELKSDLDRAGFNRS
jgi:hypothetical protein